MWYNYFHILFEVAIGPVTVSLLHGYIRSTVMNMFNPLVSLGMLTSSDVMLASRSLGVLMYVRNVELYQHPSAWIMESSISA